MGVLAIWKVLEEITIEFRKKGIAIPQNIIDDLKATKSLINIMEANKINCIEESPKISAYLGNVEAYLISEAQNMFSVERVEMWLKQIEKASHMISSNEKAKTKVQFTSKLPRNQKWVRIKPLPNLSTDKLERFAAELNLSFNLEEDGQVRIYGDSEVIKEFIKQAIKESRKNQVNNNK
jgi:hypothetical protein